MINAIHGDTESFREHFVKIFETELKDAAEQLSDGASLIDLRRAVMKSVLAALSESGANADEISRLLLECAAGSTPHPGEGWSREKNARRVELIDKLIQQTLSAEEEVELARLTEQLRRQFDTEEFVPLEGASRLLERLGIRDSELGPI